jgi:rRNA maturation endonuclease Nob1
MASGALIGTIALLWASVRTLSGDAPLPADLEALAAQNRDVDVLGEKKRRVLRALKDLEGERALGKIDEADYEAIAMQYREEAKELMREMDRNAAPALAEAERIAREYLLEKGLGVDSVKAQPPLVDGPRARLTCPGCATSNEPDATFCKKCGSAMTKAAEERDATS